VEQHILLAGVDIMSACDDLELCKCVTDTMLLLCHHISAAGWWHQYQ
jgi:hypothetical protein